MSELASQRRELFLRAAEEFKALLCLTPEARAAHLDALVLRDPSLAQEVRSLLRHDSLDSALLDRPVVMAPEGMMVGRYLIVSTIGEGGMGTVFLAEQVEPVKRMVALKLIKLGMDTRAVVRRFEAERQVLACMEHPGIARILDGGVAADGRPYFVMELVRGVPLTEWCDTHRLDAAARIALFLEVCSAVQHAHQKGVIHRDLKPSNLLVADVDGRPMLKVIDFGIAKALNDDGIDGNTLTSIAPVAGTPEYMSPEQAGLLTVDGFDIRSDVYSLGVVLYELLTGTTPLRARTRSGNTRRPGSIRPKLRGDLDAIILKAVEFEPRRRYATVAALAEDLERHLRNEPVRARPAGTMYVAAQFARRHTLALSAAAAVLLALVAGLGMTLWGLQRARDELFASTVERGRLSGVAGDLVEARESLWNSYLERPDSPHAAWALRELYFRYPSIWTVERRGLRSSQVEVVDENTIVVAGAGMPPFTMDVETGAVLRSCAAVEGDGDAHHPHRMDVSVDRTMVAVGDNDGDVRLWSLQGGQYLGTIARHGEGTASAVFMDSASTLATAGADGRILLVDPQHPDAPRLVWQSGSHVRSLAAHAGTGQLAAGLANGTVLLWRTLDQPPTRLQLHQDWVLCLEFDGAGERLASGSRDRSAVVWSTRNGTEVLRIPSRNGTVRDLAFAADDTLYVLGWWQLQRLRVGETKAEEVLREGGWRIAVPRLGEVIVTSDQDSAVRRWHIDAAGLFAAVPVDAGWSVRCVAAGDGPLILSKGRSIAARDFDGTQRWVHRLPAAVVAMGASADGTCVAAGAADGTLWVKRALNQEWVCIARDYPSSASEIAVDAAGQRIAYPMPGNSVVVIDLNDAALTPSEMLPPSPNEQMAVHFSRDGRTLIAAERKAGLRVADLQSKRTRIHDSEQTVFAVDTTPDGTVLMGSWTGPILIANAHRGVEESLRGHTALVGALAVHPSDPQLVLTGSMDGTVRLWHLGLKREVQSLSPLGGAPIGFVSFDAPGERVVVAGSDGSVVTWPLYVADQFIRDNFPTLQEARPSPRHQQSRPD